MSHSNPSQPDTPVTSSPPTVSTPARTLIDLNSIEEPLYVLLLKRGEPYSMRDLLSIADKELLIDINDHLYKTAYSGKHKRTEPLSDVLERACHQIIHLKENKIHYVPFGIIAWLACKGRDTIPGYELQDHLTSDNELRNKIGGILVPPTQPLLREDHIIRCFKVLGEITKNYNENEMKEREPKRATSILGEKNESGCSTDTLCSSIQTLCLTNTEVE